MGGGWEESQGGCWQQWQQEVEVEREKAEQITLAPQKVRSKGTVHLSSPPCRVVLIDNGCSLASDLERGTEERETETGLVSGGGDPETGVNEGEGQERDPVNERGAQDLVNGGGDHPGNDQGRCLVNEGRGQEEDLVNERDGQDHASRGGGQGIVLETKRESKVRLMSGAGREADPGIAEAIQGTEIGTQN